MRNFGLFAVFFCTLSLQAADFEKISIEDATKEKIELSGPAKRILPLAPSLAELVVELLESEAQGRIVARTEHTESLSQLKDHPSVGSYVRPSLEKIVSLKPDLVIATQDGNPRELILRIRELGVPVLVVRTSSFEQIYQSMEWVGIALGKEDRAQKLVNSLKGTVSALRDNRPVKKRKVFLQIGHDPVVTVGSQSFLSEALVVAGGENIFSDLTNPYPRPSLETILERDPEVILILGMSEDEKQEKEIRLFWQRFSSIPAVRDQQIHFLKLDSLLRPSSRLSEGLKALAVFLKETDE
jgi:iron complex transport system substrate-binding protein